jgi:diamine N-acetyltransferase
VGIIIQNEVDRNSGYGKEALGLMIDYCFKQLQLHQ